MRKPLVEECERLRICDVRAAIPKNAIEATLEIGEHEVRVVGRITNLKNGYRYCFVCYECKRPYESLFRTDFGQFSCRNCTGIVYCSTRKKEVVFGQYEHEQAIIDRAECATIPE